MNYLKHISQIHHFSVERSITYSRSNHNIIFPTLKPLGNGIFLNIQNLIDHSIRMMIESFLGLNKETRRYVGINIQTVSWRIDSVSVA